MSIGTRKKILDFKKMLNNDVESEYSSVDLSKAHYSKSGKKNQNDSASKQKGNTISDFIGKKRKNISSSSVQNDKEHRHIKPKDIEQSDKLSKEEFSAILSNYSEEISYLQKENAISASTVSKNDNKPTSLVSDLNSLNYNLFLCTKFENSKPYKMIDYIISNDNYILNRQNDKDKFEEMKKPIFTKGKNDSENNINILYKSLYEYFKTDFSTSYLSLLFEEVNSFIQKKYNKDNTSNKDDISMTEDKKDKFTYSNYVTDRLKQKNKASLISYTSDVDFVKSLIYLNNKFNKYLNKKNKIYKNLLVALKNNLEVIDGLEAKQDKHNFNEEEHNFLNKIIKHKKMHNSIKTHFNNLLTCLDDIKNASLSKEAYEKIIDIIAFKSKEDEYEKISKILNETMKLHFDKNKVKNIWIGIRFLFNLISLSNNSHITSYYSDNKFWCELLSYVAKRKMNKKVTHVSSSASLPGNYNTVMKTLLPKFKSPINLVNLSNNNTMLKIPKRSDITPIDTVKREENQPIPIDPTEDIKTTVVDKFEKGEDIFTVYRESIKKKKEKKENPKQNEPQKVLSLNELPIASKTINNDDKTLSSKTISEGEDEESSQKVPEIHSSILPNQKSIQVEKTGNVIYNTTTNTNHNITINNTFTNDSKLKHKEGGIFDIVVSTGEQKKKKSKPRKEENDLLPQSELKPKKKRSKKPTVIPPPQVVINNNIILPPNESQESSQSNVNKIHKIQIKVINESLYASSTSNVVNTNVINNISNLSNDKTI